MYVNVNDLEALPGNLVLKMVKWPSTFTTTLLIPDSVSNSYDNGRELYLGEVKSSGDSSYVAGDFVAISMYFGVHVPSEVRTEKIKIVPATGVVLKSVKMLEVMSDVSKMEPGINRILVKLKKKESKTAGGLYIPDDVLSQDPTAQDVRVAEVVKSNDATVSAGDVVLLEAGVGQDVYLDAEKDLYIVCYGIDVLAKINI